MATVADIMDRDPVTVGPEATLEDVLGVLRDHELTGVPVVNDGGRCVGIITDSDLVLSEEGADLHLPHFVELFGGVIYLERLSHFEDRLKKAAAATAGDLMTPDPVTIDAGRDIRDAAHVIVDSGHNRLPVTEHGRLVGVVTRVDVLGALARE